MLTAADALGAPMHLACIAGPDIGSVIPVEDGLILGRCGTYPLSDDAVSRQHCKIRCVVTRRTTLWQMTSLQRGAPLLWRISLLPWQRIGVDRWTTLRPSMRLRCGEDIFQVRRRPRRLLWAEPSATAFSGRTLVTRLLPAIFFAFLLWRLPLMMRVFLPDIDASRLPVWIGGAGAVVLILFATRWCRSALRSRRLWKQCDAAMLALVLAARRVPSLSKDGVVAFWPQQVRPWGVQYLQISDRAPRDSKGPPPCTSPGFYGSACEASAYWCAAQVALGVGGARIHCPDGTVIALGRPVRDVYLHAGTADIGVESSAPTDAAAVDANAINIAYAPSLMALPAWCDAAFHAKRPMTSHLWWLLCGGGCIDSGALPDLVYVNELAAASPSVQEPLASPSPAPQGTLATTSPSLQGTLAATLGVGKQGVVSIDLVSDGPHALVAGTTGSGKSEALLTWILALAQRYPPEMVQFVLLDYKGGATFGALRPLPHVATILTDLTPGDTLRCLKGLDSHIQWREAILAQAGYPSLDAWEAACLARANANAGWSDPGTSAAGTAAASTADAGMVAERSAIHGADPLPRLVIVIDEFRQLSCAHSDAMDTLVRLAAQGRSLGVHIIAATQRPAGIVSAAIRANMDLKLVFRCAEPADSLDVLGNDLAAQLPRLPGRAHLRGYGDVQCALTPHVPRIVDTIVSKYPTFGRQYLWLPPLPEVLTWSQVWDEHPASTDTAKTTLNQTTLPIALIDTLESDPSAVVPPVALASSIRRTADGGNTLGTYPRLAWDECHLAVEGPFSEAPLLRRGAQSLASAIAHARDARLHCLYVPVSTHTRARPAYVSGSWLDVDNAGDTTYVLEYVEHLGPGVLLIEDVPRLVGAIDRRLGASAGKQLLSTLLTRAAQYDVQAVAVIPGYGRDQNGSFSTRLIRAHTTTERMLARLPSRVPDLLAPNHFLFERVGTTGLCAIPLDPYVAACTANSAGNNTVGQEPCRNNVSHPFTAPLVRSENDVYDRGVLLIGADFHAYQPTTQCSWVLIGEHSLKILPYLNNAYTCVGLPPLRLIDDGEPAPGEVTVVPAQRVPLIRIMRGQNYLAAEPSIDTIRVLRSATSRNSRAPWAQHWHEHNGLIVINGNTERFLVLPSSPADIKKSADEVT
ncbi:FtsK/SpoIIIE domain-containing protein [Schaalia suimastitidis]|uniref:FtsK/SpoIIIE domain-containing protein n=1 Tax=Schaalia suimastitidis TaxID=121163 RepID=UPI00040D2479|nr:FtsK/SpoIIIE domain-containing protein [Schaalia suimastitidis]